MDIKILLWYDVEDYITPEADDALNGLIDMMDKRGIRASLKFVAEKARVLRDRGRADILAKLAGHEICYHTNLHSAHPSISEYLEGYAFAEGSGEFLRREERGLQDVVEITGQFCTSYGQPGGAWAPQVFPALRRWGIQTYLDSHDIINVNGKAFWYGGVLNLTRLDPTMRMNLNGEGDLEAAKREFDTICKRDVDGTLLVSIYYHPCEFSCVEFWDGVNFGHGKNTPRSEWKPATLRKPGEMETLIESLGQFIDYTLEKGNVEYITASQTLSQRHEIINKSDVQAFAPTVQKSVSFAGMGKNQYASSELLSVMAKYINGKHLNPILSYGPEKAAESYFASPFTVCELADAFETQYSRVFGYRQLPELYKIGDSIINPADMFCTLAGAIAQGLGKDDIAKPIRGKLAAAQYVNGDTDWSGRRKWPIFPDAFNVPNIVNMARLQTWTLKPAQMR